MAEALLAVTVDGQTVQVAPGSSVVAAVAQAARVAKTGVITRRSVSGELRGPLCGMGVCQECRVTIDGVRHRLACQTLCAEGMTVCTGRTES
ncbi:2Fe-2S iron-sulfur cluster-binding protein [Paraburkholderia sp.]|uniref:2Fe-2S iron-sulfur cluster-binding protein n=1 Tax=Paraburkholderia sp. TaxID=1926495 RepID=UPI0025E34E32|nr:2Fe-2S iron-sulfur cluster-binding protein [Paraburkholderia sp.]